MVELDRAVNVCDHESRDYGVVLAAVWHRCYGHDGLLVEYQNSP